MARNIIIFGINSSNSVHATNKTQNILILGHGLTQKVNNITTYAEKMYSPNFSAENKIFCLSLHYNGDNSYLFVNGTEVTKFKAKKSEIKADQLTLGSISTSANLSNSNIEDSKLCGNVYNFSVDYSAISIDKIHVIHACLIRKNGIILMFGFIKKFFFTAMTFFNLSNVNSLKCVLMNNKESKIRTETINLNTNEPMFYPCSIKIYK